MKNIDYSVDKSNLRQVILNSPEQLAWVLDNWEKINFNKKFSNVILCGMGGSAWPMEFVINYLTTNPKSRLSKIPFIIHRSYDLPDEASKSSLIIFSSYSGNTEETISSYKAAYRAGITGIVITSGGLLEKLAIKNDTLILKIPEKNIPPRYSTGYMVGFLLKLLINAKIIKNVSQDIVETSTCLVKALEGNKLEEKGYNLAKKIGKRIPLIYTSVNYRIAAKVWKIKINENAKMPAFWNHMPEFNHNEMVGFTHANPKQFFVLILKNKNDSKKLLKILTISEVLLSDRGFHPEIINLVGDNFFSKVFFSALLCDWVSYYLALMNKVDPSPVPIVDEFKKALKDK